MIISFVLAIVFLGSIVPTSSNAVNSKSENLVAQCHAHILIGEPTSSPCLVLFGAIPQGSDSGSSGAGGAGSGSAGGSSGGAGSGSAGGSSGGAGSGGGGGGGGGA